jgi:hypothetical protein
MPTNDEILAKLDKIDKTVSKILSINTKIAKTLHLIPVTEKEERDIQILQRKNLELAAKVNDELNSMENKTEDPSESLFDSIQGNVFNDVLGDDFLNRS